MYMNMPNLFLQLWINPIRKQNLFKILKAEGVHTLYGLATFMNNENKCSPGLKTLGRLLGIKDKSTVSRRIKNLVMKKFEGEPILTVTRSKHVNESGKIVYKNNSYYINPKIISIFQKYE